MVRHKISGLEASKGCLVRRSKPDFDTLSISTNPTNDDEIPPCQPCDTRHLHPVCQQAGRPVPLLSLPIRQTSSRATLAVRPHVPVHTPSPSGPQAISWPGKASLKRASRKAPGKVSRKAAPKERGNRLRKQGRPLLADSPQSSPEPQASFSGRRKRRISERGQTPS